MVLDIDHRLSPVHLALNRLKMPRQSRNSANSYFPIDCTDNADDDGGSSCAHSAHCVTRRDNRNRNKGSSERTGADRTRRDNN